MFPIFPESNDTVVVVSSQKQGQPLSFRSFQYSANNGCSPDGCSIIFDANSQFQYFPSNSYSYSMVLSGNIKAQYEDGSVVYYTNPYTSTWSGYRDVWNYSESVDVRLKTSDQFFLTIRHINSTSDLYSFNGAKIVGTQISKTTQSNTYVFVFGSDYSYKVDGKEFEFKDGNGKPYHIQSFPGGNTHTHVFTANSSPITIFILEKNS